MDSNAVIYMLVELTFFAVFFVCLRDAWRRGKHGDIPPDLRRASRQDPPPPGKRRAEDDERARYIQPEDEWERLPVGSDRSKRQPGSLWVCIMLAAMVFTFTFEYKLTHRTIPAVEATATSPAKEEGPPGSFSIYSYEAEALISFGAIKEKVGSEDIQERYGWAADGECVAPDKLLGDGRCQKDGSAVPLWIPCGWALIIFLVMRTSDKLAIAWWKRPILDGLMALIIDFALDPVASWSHWWRWDFGKLQAVGAEQGLDINPTIFFKVPATNYMAWVVIVGSFSFFVRLFQHWRTAKFDQGLHRIPSKLFGLLPNNFFGDLVGPLLASVPAVIVVILYTNHARWLMAQGEWFTNGALLCSVVWAGLLAFLYRDAPVVRRDHAHDHVLMFSPLAIYAAVIIALYCSKVPQRNGDTVMRIVDGVKQAVPLNEMMLYEAMPELIIIVPLSAIIGVVVFAWPYSKPGPESWW